MDLPNFVITCDFNTINVVFNPDIPKVVKYHLTQKLSRFVGMKMATSSTLEEIRVVISSELQYLIRTSQLYSIGGEWHFTQDKDETKFNYNTLNFQ